MSLDLGALDLSLTGTAVAHHHPDGSITVETVDTSRLDGHRRLAEILLHVAKLRYCRMVVIEDVFKGLKGDAALKLAGLSYLVRHWLWIVGVPYTLVTNAHLKQYATGKGSGAGSDKDAVVLAVERRYGGRVQIRNNNEADALTLLCMALDHYGMPLADVPAVNRAALVKVGEYLSGWPVIDPESGAAIQSPAPGPAPKRG